MPRTSLLSISFLIGLAKKFVGGFLQLLMENPQKNFLSPLDSKEIKPVNPKEINPEFSLEGLMLKLKLQYFGHLIQRSNSLEKTVMLGKIEGQRRRG